MPCDDPADARAAILALLAERALDATICPSEVARVLAGASGETDWRAEMPTVHAAIDAMLGAGAVRLSWRGTAMPVREGPYRIGVGAQGNERSM